MPKTIRFLNTLAAVLALVALAPRGHAQIETFQTLTQYNGNQIEGFTNGTTAMAETFNNILELQSITFRFTTTGTGSTQDQNFSAYLVQWSGNASAGYAPLTTISTPTDPNATLVGGSNPTDQTATVLSTPAATFTVPPLTGDQYGTWSTDTFSSGGTYNGFDVTLNLNQYTDPSITYAIIIVDNTNASGLGLGVDSTNQDAFTEGYATQEQGDATLSAMQNDPNGPPFGTIGRATADYTFSQIVVVPAGNTVPTPEPRDAALVLCAGFVAFLVGRRLLKQDEETLPGAIAA